MSPELECVPDVAQGLRIRRLGLADSRPWCEDGPAFVVGVDGELISGQSCGVAVDEIETVDHGDGVHDRTVQCSRTGPSPLGIDWHLRTFAGSAVVEMWVVVRNTGARPVTIERLDSVAIALVTGDAELLSFTSSWGEEFGPVREPMVGERVLGTDRGRSSHVQHPMFVLSRADGAVLCGGVAWSGNWVLRFEPVPEVGHHLLTGGLRNEGFAKQLRPGAEVEAPHVVLALGGEANLDTVSADLTRVGRRHWVPRSELADRLPIEWNHWWPYEDHSIDEQVFRANVDIAAELGVEVCTLDAGWFGAPGAPWTDLRGDWDVVNEARFPNGIRALSDYVHDKGMRFGLWCEIEALGRRAELAERHPDFPALRDGAPLGYVCLGNPDAADWAFRTLDRLVSVDGADWIKLDFNVDPGSGCDRTDHGHGSGDGLFEHYNGYYRLLDRVRAAHPDLVLENCSSGGLRIDLGIMRHTHLTFLSDPDWPEHGLQLLWGASIMLPPNQLLHWGYSQWHSEHRCQSLDPGDTDLEPHRIAYYRRIAMLGATGFSYRLPELSPGFRSALRLANETYRTVVRRFVRAGTLRRLTGQPERFGMGERWAGFQHSMTDRPEHLLSVFRLPGGEPQRTIRPRGLSADASYGVTRLDAARTEVRSGRELMDDGLRFELPEEGSELVLVRSR